MNNYKIYAHVNKINNKLYIGQTQQSTEMRWQNGNGYNPYDNNKNNHFWNAIKKYGWDSFLHIVLIENLSAEQACVIEGELIKKHNSTNPSYGYNLRSGGLISKHSQETIQKIKENHADISGENNPFYGKRHSEETIKKIKETLNGRFVKEKSPVYKRKHTDKEIESMKGDRPSVKGKNNPRSREINQYDLEGNFIRSYWGCMEVKELLGYDNSGIAKCCKRKVKTSHGYIWRYANE